MNKKQKILTAAVLILFTATLVCFPWVAHDFVGTYRLLSPFWIQPRELGLYPSQWTYSLQYSEDWKVACIFWIWLAIVYVGLLLILKSPKPRE